MFSKITLDDINFSNPESIDVRDSLARLVKIFLMENLYSRAL